MPKKTGIINREEYLQRLFKEDSKIAKKDQEYGNYLNSLSRLLMILTRKEEPNKAPPFLFAQPIEANYKSRDEKVTAFLFATPTYRGKK